MKARCLVLLLLVAALAFAGLGHYSLLYLRTHQESTIAFYALAAFLLLGAYVLAGRASASGLIVMSVRSNRLGVGIALATNVLAALIALLWPTNSWVVWLLWAGGVVSPMFLSLGTRAIYVLPLVLLFAGASQFAFDRGESGRPLGILLFLASFPVIWLFAYLEGREAGDDAEGQRPAGGPMSSLAYVLSAYRGRLCVGALAIAASAAAAVLAVDDRRSLIAGAVWLAGVGLFLLACVPPVSRARLCHALAGWREGFRRHRVEVVLAFVVLACGVFMRCYGLDYFYGAVEQDEGQYGSEALRILQGERPNLFGSVWLFNLTAVFTYLMAGSMRLFGEDVVGLRLVPALMGSLSLVFVYLLVRRGWGAPAALAATSLVAVAPHHLFSSRIAIRDMVVLLLFIPAVLYFLYRALLWRRPFEYALAGVSLGVGLWLDYNNKAMILVLIIGAVFVYWFLTQKGWHREYLKIGLFCLGVVVVLLPVWVTLARMDGIRPEGGFLRGRLVLQAPNLAVAQQRYGVSDPFHVFLHQVERNVFGVNYYRDESFLTCYAGWLSRRPMVNSVVAVLFLVGLAYSVWRWRQPRYAFLLIAWAVGMQGGIWGDRPPKIHYLIAPALVPVCAMAALGLVKMAGVIVRPLRLNTISKGILLGVIIAAVLGYIAYVDLSIYFAPQSVALAWEEWPLPDNMSWIGLSKTGERIRELSRDYQVYYLGAPLVYATGHGTILFHSGLASLSAIDVEDIGAVVPLRETATRDVAFVVAPVHFGDLERLQHCYPEGRLQEWRDERVEGVCFKTFLVTQEQANDPAADCR